jgi:shikimate kinase
LSGTNITLEKHVALVGFMAAGKSTVGKHLAREIGVAFLDTDDLIVARHGPIPALFARLGEPGFRALELEAVREALERPPGILALGGGAVTHAPTRELLAAHALRVFLDIPAETLVARLHRSRGLRPLVGKAPTLEGIRALLAAREPLYLESDFVVRGPHRTQAAFAREIAKRLQQS